MSWRPPGYRFTARELVMALCSDDTDESKLLMAAIYGKVELFADSTAWNGFLWLVMNTFKVEENLCTLEQNSERSKKVFPLYGSNSFRTSPTTHGRTNAIGP